jgi:hypothetical protein
MLWVSSEYKSRDKMTYTNLGLLWALWQNSGKKVAKNGIQCYASVRLERKVLSHSHFLSHIMRDS